MVAGERESGAAKSSATAAVCACVCACVLGPALTKVSTHQRLLGVRCNLQAFKVLAQSPFGVARCKQPEPQSICATCGAALTASRTSTALSARRHAR